MTSLGAGVCETGVFAGTTGATGVTDSGIVVRIAGDDEGGFNRLPDRGCPRLQAAFSRSQSEQASSPGASYGCVGNSVTDGVWRRRGAEIAESGRKPRVNFRSSSHRQVVNAVGYGCERS